MTAAAKLVRSPAKARWPQMGIVKSMLIASTGPARGLSRGLSRMWGNSQVRFLGGWAAAMPPGYPAADPMS